ncbi:hypothetical protein J5N97_009930 [Dioscorea zingiberensis]|uniref:Uncharacterized protein n=1 Tax=Dioscorea zingiberensis TaxID=325984 RepID=A0A9D5HLY9_9LILI|nr:hypothetical protein J5N97_009930 [Dioscorea zingiberensis]
MAPFRLHGLHSLSPTWLFWEIESLEPFHMSLSLGKLVNLDRLHLSVNNISGQLPESLGNLNNLTEFRIDGNPLTGKIPSFIGNWKKISRII